MKQLRDGSGIGALVWLRGAVFVLAACIAAQAGIAQSVRLVPSTSRFAGDGTGNPTNDGPGTATTIPLTAPTYVASDVSGNIYISDTGNNCIRRVDTSGQMTVARGQGRRQHLHRASTVTTYTTGVSSPSGLALDAAGDLFVADTGHNCVRRLSAGATGIAICSRWSAPAPILRTSRSRPHPPASRSTPPATSISPSTTLRTTSSRYFAAVRRTMLLSACSAARHRLLSPPVPSVPAPPAA